MLMLSIIREPTLKKTYVSLNVIAKLNFASGLDSTRIKALYNSFLAPIIHRRRYIFEEVYVLFLLSIAGTHGDYRFYEIVGRLFRNVILRSSRRHFFIYNTRAIARITMADAQNIFPMRTL